MFGSTESPALTPVIEIAKPETLELVLLVPSELTHVPGALLPPVRPGVTTGLSLGFAVPFTLSDKPLCAALPPAMPTKSQ